MTPAIDHHSKTFQFFAGIYALTKAGKTLELRRKMAAQFLFFLCCWNVS